MKKNDKKSNSHKYYFVNHLKKNLSLYYRKIKKKYRTN